MLKAAVIEDGEYYRLLTAMFMHFGISHLVNNMIVLFALGDNLERALGHVKYLILYLFSGIGANWISMMIGNKDPMVVSAGASGAIFGVIGGLFYAVAVNKGRLEDLQTKQLAVMIVLSLYMGLTSSGVDNACLLYTSCVSSGLVTIFEICIDVNTIGSFALNFHHALIECRTDMSGPPSSEKSTAHSK